MSSTQKTLLTLTLLGFGVFLLEMARVLNLSLFSLWFGVSTALTFCCVSLKNAKTAPEKWLYGIGVLLTFVLFLWVSVMMVLVVGMGDRPPTTP